MRMLKFWLWFNGFFTLYGLCWMVVGILNGDMIQVILQGIYTCCMFCMFMLQRRFIRQRRDRDAIIAGQHRIEWFPMYDPGYHKYTKDVRVCSHVTLKIAEGWNVKSTKFIDCAYCRKRGIRRKVSA